MPATIFEIGTAVILKTAVRRKSGRPSLVSPHHCLLNKPFAICPSIAPMEEDRTPSAQENIQWLQPPFILYLLVAAGAITATWREGRGTAWTAYRILGLLLSPVWFGQPASWWSSYRLSSAAVAGRDKVGFECFSCPSQTYIRMTKVLRKIRIRMAVAPSRLAQRRRVDRKDCNNAAQCVHAGLHEYAATHVR